MPGKDARWWHVKFGFEDVLERWEDARLADAVERIWGRSGLASGVVVAWRPSAGEHPIHWYVSSEAAACLDRDGVPWRRFAHGTVAELPPASRILTPLASTLRRAGGSPPPYSIAGFHAADHDRVTVLLAEAAELVDRGQLGAALSVFGRLDEAVARHFAVEEAVLFPLFEERAATARGVTGALLEEHAAIRRGMDATRHALARGDQARFREGHQLLALHLPGHFEREQLSVFPALDEVLASDERAGVLARLRAP